MKRLDLDYALSAKPYPTWVRFSLLLLAASLLVMMAICYQTLKTELAQHQSAVTMSQQQEAKPSRPDLPEAMNYAMKVEQSLNYPWLTLFSYLEDIKSKHQKIDLLKVEPSKAKAEIRLQGEAKNFDDITYLIQDIKAHEAFEDAVLINQYLVESETPAENNGKPLLTFNLLLKWRVQ